MTKKTPFPEWIDPMLATLTSERFSDEDWIYEEKYDGERCIAYKRDGYVKLMSRNRKILNDSYPEVAKAIEKQRIEDYVVDGEIVSFRNGVSSFQQLQNRMGIKEANIELSKKVPVTYCIFDLLYLNGYDTTGLSLLRRKEMLEEAVEFNEPLLNTRTVKGKGVEYYKEACRKGWEGVIAKRADSIYEQGRSKSWLKFKCIMEQEMVIGGYTDPEGSRFGFGALLMGYYANDKLVYAGKVGTGYDTETLGALREKLRHLETDEPAFGKEDGLPKNHVHWVRPQLVAQIAFAEWTKDGKLRQGRFTGLRRDKKPREVIREVPEK